MTKSVLNQTAICAGKIMTDSKVTKPQQTSHVWSMSSQCLVNVLNGNLQPRTLLLLLCDCRFCCDLLHWGTGLVMTAGVMLGGLCCKHMRWGGPSKNSNMGVKTDLQPCTSECFAPINGVYK